MLPPLGPADEATKQAAREREEARQLEIARKEMAEQWEERRPLLESGIEAVRWRLRAASRRATLASAACRCPALTRIEPHLARLGRRVIPRPPGALKDICSAFPPQSAQAPGSGDETLDPPKPSGRHSLAWKEARRER